ncbi:MAG: lysozyme [Candidatus Afipia apatlaquensis]|uniref:Lysozyme n=1 Tax=Candidatus Afipia apatlaquensis TaxID=2712852 RepID=A0A7C9RJG9_9BRAD|nr:lysozyme [Candidatus Afipia apatlaquensis]
MKNAKGVGAAVAAIAIAVPVVASFEGLWLTAKPDRLAYNIPTVCYGETEGVRVGDKYSKSECQAMLANKLPRYAAEIAKCIRVPISDKTRAAFISFAYNVGSAGFCKSTAARKLNSGDIRGACDALMAWNRAGGKVVKGLVNRRAAERAMCLEGI